MDLNICWWRQLVAASISFSSVFSLFPLPVVLFLIGTLSPVRHSLQNCRQKNISFFPHRIHVNVNSAQVCVVSGSHTFRRFCMFSWDTFWCEHAAKINGTICFLVFQSVWVFSMFIHLGQSEDGLFCCFVCFFWPEGVQDLKGRDDFPEQTTLSNGYAAKPAFRTPPLWWFCKS